MFCEDQAYMRLVGQRAEEGGGQTEGALAGVQLLTAALELALERVETRLTEPAGDPALELSM